MNGAEVLTRFTADTSGVDKAVKNTSTSLGKLTTAFTLGNVAASAINKTMQIMSQNLDSAITRYDTMNNFPNVMKNLGISADDANEVISDMAEKLTGLPTSLDAGARAVQRFTSVNGDVKESENLFLAVNNAILAGGASADIQASALEQISQAYSKGKPDMMEWRTMLTAMPAQIKQVASSMGMTSDQLGTGLRDGSISMDTFMNKIVELNEKGTGEFASFEEQARGATKGISTSIKNMKTAFARGISTMITKIDSALAPMGGLTGVIGNIGKIGESVFGSLGDTIGLMLPPLIELVQGIAPQLSTFFTQLGALFKQFMPSLIQIAQQILPVIMNLINQLLPFIMQIIETVMPVMIDLINTLLPPVMQIVSALLPLLLKLLQPVLKLLQPILDLLKPIIDVLMAIITPLIEILDMILPPLIDLISNNLMIVIQHITEAFNFWAKIITNVLAIAFNNLKPVIENIKGVFEGLIKFIKGVFSGNWKQAWQGVKDIFSNIMSGLGNIVKAPINYIIDGLNKFINGVNKVQIPDWVPAVGGKGLHIPNIPKLATGTNFVPEDTLAMIHKGEAVVPKKFNPYANGLDNSTIGNMLAGKQQIIVNVQNDIELDPLGQVVSKIKTFSGGARNDYNYGMGGSRLA